MGRRSLDKGSVRAVGKDRIEFTIWIGDKRYRPWVKQSTSPANMRRAERQLLQIQDRIAEGTFNLAEEFPEYRFKHRLPATTAGPAKVAPAAPPPEPTALYVTQQLTLDANDPRHRTCDAVVADFLFHCQTRVAMNDLAYSTYNGYRKLLENVWSPKIGRELLGTITYSRLATIAAEHVGFTAATLNVDGDLSSLKPKAKKTYNNLVSAIRCCFEHGYKDYPQYHNPATGLKTFRLRKKERRPPDPFTIQEAEAIIARSHREFGETHGNYEEFRFFSALRQSELMALTLQDCDLFNGRIRITKAVVLGRHKDYTKTGEDREIELCGRALDVLKRQLALRETYSREGKIDHVFVFFDESGAPLSELSYAYDRWVYVVEQVGVRYREPYQARASYISWSLMIGKNIIKLAQEDGHSIETMLRNYAAWTKGAREEDVSVIKQAIETSPKPPSIDPSGTQDPRFLPVAGGWGRLSWRKRQRFNTKDWRSGRDSNPRPPA